MQKFFDDFDSLNRFSLSLDFHQDRVKCAFCSKNNQFISHGIIYKQRSSQLAEKIGKRLFCSNRYGRRGCGHTVQLYVANEFPSFRYNASHWFIFITALLAHLPVKKAYFKATGQSTSRNAWRWLLCLELKLSQFRTFLKNSVDNLSDSFQSRARRLHILLPTLLQLQRSFKDNICCGYQLAQQDAFI